MMLAGGLAVLALAASALSAVTGVGGGVLLLSGLLLLAPAASVVPLHGAVQTVACLARVGAFRSHVRWDIVRRFVVGTVIGSLLGAVVVQQLLSVDGRLLKLLIAGAILLSLLAKRWRIQSSARSLRAFYGVGLAVGFFGILAGSTGPIVTQALLVFDVRKEAHIATKSVVQAIGHGLKIPLFGLAIGFDFGPWLAPLAAMMVAVVAGTYLGRHLLGKLSSERFVTLARTLLALVVVYIAASEAYALAS